MFGEEVVLDAIIDTDIDSSLSYLWKEVNKILSYEKTFHIYNPSKGVHNISLIVEDDKGNVGNDSIVITVN